MDAGDVTFRRGTADDLTLLDRTDHALEHVAELRERLAKDEYWLIGLRGLDIVTYTWLHGRATCAYPSLPGCEFTLAPETAYGYDAWTPPALRGGGLRRRAFVHELRVLAGWGRAWEGSFFVAHQLEGATKSLAEVGIRVVPLWRVTLDKDRSLRYEQVGDDQAAALMRPAALTTAT